MANIGTNSVAAKYIGGNSVVSVYRGSTLAWSVTPSPPFSPDDISGLQLWLDSSDSSTITLSGSNVSQWNDKSSNGWSVSQGTSLQQPALISSGLNSKDVIRFDGSNDSLINASITPVSGSTNRTIFAVSNYTGTGVLYNAYFGTTQSNGRVLGVSNEIAVRIYGGNRVWTTGVDSTHCTTTIMLDGTTPSNLSAWKDGSPLSVSSTANQTINTTAGVYIGKSVTNTSYWNGDIAEVLVYDSALSTSDRESVESYLSTKWGL